MHTRIIVLLLLLLTGMLVANGSALTESASASTNVQTRAASAVTDPRVAGWLPPSTFGKWIVRRFVRPFRIIAEAPRPNVTTLRPVRPNVVRARRAARRLHLIATRRPHDWASVCLNLALRKRAYEAYGQIRAQLMRYGYPGTAAQVGAVVWWAAVEMWTEFLKSQVPYASFVDVFDTVRSLTEGDVDAIADALCM